MATGEQRRKIVTHSVFEQAHSDALSTALPFPYRFIVDDDVLVGLGSVRPYDVPGDTHPLVGVVILDAS